MLMAEVWTKDINIDWMTLWSGFMRGNSDVFLFDQRDRDSFSKPGHFMYENQLGDDHTHTNTQLNSILKKKNFKWLSFPLLKWTAVVVLLFWITGERYDNWANQVKAKPERKGNCNNFLNSHFTSGILYGPQTLFNCIQQEYLMLKWRKDQSIDIYFNSIEIVGLFLGFWYNDHIIVIKV